MAPRTRPRPPRAGLAAGERSAAPQRARTSGHRRIALPGDPVRRAGHRRLPAAARAPPARVRRNRRTRVDVASAREWLAGGGKRGDDTVPRGRLVPARAVPAAPGDDRSGTRAAPARDRAARGAELAERRSGERADRGLGERAPGLRHRPGAARRRAARHRTRRRARTHGLDHAGGPGTGDAGAQDRHHGRRRKRTRTREPAWRRPAPCVLLVVGRRRRRRHHERHLGRARRVGALPVVRHRGSLRPHRVRACRLGRHPARGSRVPRRHLARNRAAPPRFRSPSG